jgi:hypothetical protein
MLVLFAGWMVAMDLFSIALMLGFVCAGFLFFSVRAATYVSVQIAIATVAAAILASFQTVIAMFHVSESQLSTGLYLTVGSIIGMALAAGILAAFHHDSDSAS